ncbi:MAG: sulfite oxidase-like oxidoreductase [Anaerolineaceae bacterium]|nr:sulfite oxidase-like oxidoreductase [Anaerolineaceae bacterium]MBN2677366.1 sulfite oxidase-like oxidoreductase [Anaerolineaceae bacterium]
MTETERDRREVEEQVRRQGRLPPNQAVTVKFPVLHYGPIPVFNPETWNFRVWGEVIENRDWSWEEFNQFPRTSLKMDIHCVTGWSMFDTIWEGVSVADLINEGFIQIKPTAQYVLQHAEHGYATNLPLETVLANNFILATHFNGQILTPEHGFPLRGVIGSIIGQPDLKQSYFWKGAKWLRGLEFLKEDKLGFWENAGYHNRGDVWKEERYG